MGKSILKAVVVVIIVCYFTFIITSIIAVKNIASDLNNAYKDYYEKIENFTDISKEE